MIRYSRWTATLLVGLLGCSGQGSEPSTTRISTSTSMSLPASTSSMTTQPPTTSPGYATVSGYPPNVGWHPDPALGITIPGSPYPEWQGGDTLELSVPWRFWVTIDGCGFEFMWFNDTWWKQTERMYRPGTTGMTPGLGDNYSTHSYPSTWDVYELGFISGPMIQVDGVITLVSTDQIEARAHNGDLVAIYEPTLETPPACAA